VSLPLPKLSYSPCLGYCSQPTLSTIPAFLV
jgi:hypothetical protein